MSQPATELRPSSGAGAASVTSLGAPTAPFGGIHRRCLLFTFPEAGNPRSFRGAPAGEAKGREISDFKRGRSSAHPSRLRPVREGCSFSVGKGAPSKHGRRNQETESILKKSPGACPGSSRAPGRSAARVGLLEPNWQRNFGPPREPGLRPPPRWERRLLLLGGSIADVLFFCFPEAGNPISFRGAPAGEADKSAISKGGAPRSTP